MSSAVTADIIGYVGAAFTAAMSMLQAVRIRRRGLEGVSSTTWAIVFCLMTFWVAYGIGTMLWPIIIGNAVCLVVVLYTLWCIGPARSIKALPIPIVATAAVTGIPVAIWGWEAGLPGAGAVAIALAVPQIAELYRTDTAAGVSANAWITASISVAIWIVYGIMVRKFVMVATDVVILTMDLIVVALTLARHRKLARMEAAASA